MGEISWSGRMEIVNVCDSRTHLSRLLDRVAAGKEVAIARAGKPVAKLVPLPPAMPRPPGLQWALPTPLDGFFFDPLPEDEQRLWDAGDDGGR